MHASGKPAGRCVFELGITGVQLLLLETLGFEQRKPGRIENRASEIRPKLGVPRRVPAAFRLAGKIAGLKVQIGKKTVQAADCPAKQVTLFFRQDSSSAIPSPVSALTVSVRNDL